MIGSECKHKEYGLISKITGELKGTKDFPDQWGIYWYKPIPLKFSCYYWNDKDSIEIIDNWILIYREKKVNSET